MSFILPLYAIAEEGSAPLDE
uniref:Uncharacterized protein n=1 Tax=Arundo donax TaxID=35708 RepID=A0A0A8ZRK4_ARUDO